MKNITVNKGKVKPAGIDEFCVIVGTQIVQKERKIDAVGKADRKANGIIDNVKIVKAYDGGNPNKVKNSKDVER